MNYRIISFILAIFCVIFTLIGCGKTNEHLEDKSINSDDFTPQKYICVQLVDEGVNMYEVPKQANFGYRYGPSMIVNEDNSIDVFFAAPGSQGEWDWLTYKHSPDGGKTWDSEKKVLGPTPGSEDAFSTCDPGIIKIGDYYYLGYTSTQNPNGIYNSLYVGRSTNIEGPYEKWDGRGWGGKPKPIVQYTENPECWGCGEPSFVVLDDKLFVYYSWRSMNSTGLINETRLSIADATDENWPKTLEYQGVAISHPNYDCDSIDVKYVDEYKMFLAVNCCQRLLVDSYIEFYESNDGINFAKCSKIEDEIYYFCHNAGISGNESGHITKDTPLYLGYAYGKDWAKWDTRLCQLNLSLSDEFYDNGNRTGPYCKPISYCDYQDVSYTIGITDESRTIEIKKDIGIASIKMLSVDGAFRTHDITNEVEFVDYDNSILSIQDGVITVKKLGNTYITAKYRDHTCQIYVLVTNN